jgi:RNA polymerase-binding transcription factor DksA
MTNENKKNQKRTDIDFEHFKQKLEEELKILTDELQSIGRINPANPADWEATPAKIDTLESDLNEVADRIGAYEGNTAALKELEIRYNQVKHALKKIEDGTYGICEATNDPISIKRLEANPAARTCMDHLENQERKK